MGNMDLPSGRPPGNFQLQKTSMRSGKSVFCNTKTVATDDSQSFPNRRKRCGPALFCLEGANYGLLHTEPYILLDKTSPTPPIIGAGAREGWPAPFFVSIDLTGPFGATPLAPQINKHPLRHSNIHLFCRPKLYPTRHLNCTFRSHIH